MADRHFNCHSHTIVLWEGKAEQGRFEDLQGREGIFILLAE